MFRILALGLVVWLALDVLAVIGWVWLKRGQPRDDMEWYV